MSDISATIFDHPITASLNRRVAFYGGSFDPLHDGHLTIARKLTEQFELDQFVFVPAFHAPHKGKKPTSGYHRYAMICLATANEAKIKVSAVELELPDKPFTVETLERLKTELPGAEIFFVMGADSWTDITTWREWEKVLTMVNIIVVTRPDYEIGFSHVTDEIRARVVDLRGDEVTRRLGDEETGRRGVEERNSKSKIRNPKSKIYLSNAVQIDISATEIRQRIKEDNAGWKTDLPPETANYIEKYELYS